MKKFLVAFMSLCLCVLSYSHIEAKPLKKCYWKGKVQTCKYGVSQSEWHTTIKKYYNKKWKMTKVSTARYPYYTPEKEVFYKYSKYNNLIKKQTKWYNHHGVSEGKKIVKKSETRFYKNKTITKKQIKKYRNNYSKNREENSTYKKGKLHKKVIYTYNLKGQRKSNKNGNSYKYIRYYKKTKKGYKMTKQTKYKYNENGKAILV